MPIATIHPKLSPFLNEIKELFRAKNAYTKSKLDVREALKGDDKSLLHSYKVCNQANRVDEEMRRDSLSKTIIALIKPTNFDFTRVYEDDSIGTIVIRHALDCNVLDGTLDLPNSSLAFVRNPRSCQSELKDMFKAGIYEQDGMKITEKVTVTYRLKGKAKK